MYKLHFCFWGNVVFSNLESGGNAWMEISILFSEVCAVHNFFHWSEKTGKRRFIDRASSASTSVSVQKCETRQIEILLYFVRNQKKGGKNHEITGRKSTLSWAAVAQKRTVQGKGFWNEIHWKCHRSKCDISSRFSPSKSHKGNLSR